MAAAEAGAAGGEMAGGMQMAGMGEMAGGGNRMMHMAMPQ
jgi:hypothetical protein